MRSPLPPEPVGLKTLDPEVWLGELVQVVVDRPLGSEHPDGHFRYPVNYGHVPGTLAGDGEPIDCYVLGVGVPIGACSGVVTAVIARADDVEDKLVVALNGTWDIQRIADAVAFCEQHFSSTVICRSG